ncbi:MAG: hypothetical protein ACE5R4_12870 [Armatimonadota bacterium]
MQRRDGYGTLLAPGAAETLLARRIAVMFGLTIVLVGGTLAVRQRALRQASAFRQLLSVGKAEVVQPEMPQPRPGRKFVAVEVVMEPGGVAQSSVRPHEVRLRSSDGRGVYAALFGEPIESMFEPVEEVGAAAAQRVRLVFEVPESFQRGKVLFWGDEVGEVELVAE